MLRLHHGDCLTVMRDIPNATIDAVITDPPYPEIDRDYGRLSEAEWFRLMEGVVAETRRVLTPGGSAMFLLQPNSSRVGSMRPWFYQFMAWAAAEWNIIQDVWCHNPSAQPNVHSQRRYGLMRPSMKVCLWLGAADCYRNQDEVLLPLKECVTKAKSKQANFDIERNPSGYTMRSGRCLQTTIARGGSTPFNLLRFSNVMIPGKSSGSKGHGAGTPWGLLDWWVRYITKPGQTVLDMFSGTAQTGLVCHDLGRDYIGIERHGRYHEVALERCREAGISVLPDACQHASGVEPAHPFQGGGDQG